MKNMSRTDGYVKYGSSFCAYRSVGHRLYNTTLHIMLGNILVTKRKQRYVNFYFLLSFDNALLYGNNALLYYNAHRKLLCFIKF